MISPLTESERKDSAIEWQKFKLKPQSAIGSHSLELLLSKKKKKEKKNKKIKSTDGDVEKREAHALLVGTSKGAIMVDKTAVPHGMRTRMTRGSTTTLLSLCPQNN